MRFHVLLLVNSYVTAHDPRRGAKFKLHLEQYAKRSWNVGLLAAFQRDVPFWECLRHGSLILHESHFDRPVVRNCAVHTLGPTLSRFYQIVRLRPQSDSAVQSYINAYGTPDLIHAHGSQYAGVVALRAKHRHGIPYVLTEHMSNYARRAVPETEMPLMRRVFREAFLRLPISKPAGNRIVEVVGDCFKPWLSIPNMLDIRQYSFQEEGPSENTAIRIFSASQLVAKKNFDLLIKAFAVAFQTDEAATLRIAGDGPERANLVRLAHNLGIEDKVQFLGYIPRRKVAYELKKCSFYVISSTFETFAIPVIEAHACGKPVISTMCGGPEGMINDSNGILIPPNDAEALAGAMRVMASRLKHFDSRAISAAVKRTYSPDAILDQLGPVYEAAVSGKPFMP